MGRSLAREFPRGREGGRELSTRGRCALRVGTSSQESRGVLAELSVTVGAAVRLL